MAGIMTLSAALKKKLKVFPFLVGNSVQVSVAENSGRQFRQFSNGSESSSKSLMVNMKL